MGNVVGRRDEGDSTRRGGGAKACTPLAFCIRLQQVAVHIARTAAHRVSGHNVFGNRLFHKAIRRVDFHFARLDVSFVNHAAQAAIVVNVAVGDHHSDDRFLAAVCIVEIQRFFRRFSA